MIRLALAALVAAFALGCGFSTSPSERGGDSSEGDRAGGGGGTGGEYLPGTGAPSTGSGAGTTPGAGQMTAGVWDDNLNFDRFVAYRDNVFGVGSGLPEFTPQEQQDAQTAFEQRTPRTALEVAFVVDTTGSMGDELEYLEAEFHAIAADLAQRHPGVQMRWALVAYRDLGDTYVVRGTPFETSVSAFQAQLATLEAGGGGDIPESPEKALDWAAHQLTWDPAGHVARLVFWVADAPHHTQDAGAMLKAVRDLRDRDVHIYPVSSSGIDEFTEYTMRASAQLTGGRYLFLTDDSGIGDSHKEPSIACYVVTRLDHAIVRMVQSELSGVRVDPEPAQVLRSVGAPTEGVCALQSGQARVF